MQVKAADIMYQAWEEIPLHKLKLILQLLPQIDWDRQDDWMNTYCKNMVLKNVFRDYKLSCKLTPEQRVDLFTYELDWLRNPTHRFLIPKVKIQGANLLAPADGLTNLSVEELAEADTRLSRYLISNKPHYLHSFLACLYMDAHGDEFSEHAIEYKSLLFEEIPDYQKISIIRSYLGSRMVIMRLCDTLFPSSSPQEPKSTVPRKPQDLGPMWDELIYDLANTKGYPGMKLAREANAIEALQYLNREIRISKELRSKHQYA